MSLTDEQREAAIERMQASFVADCKYNTDAEVGITITSRKMTANVLNALLSDHVVLHRDDVTEERALSERGLGRDAPDFRRRLVTRWEPITNPTKDDPDA